MKKEIKENSWHTRSSLSNLPKYSLEGVMWDMLLTLGNFGTNPVFESVIGSSPHKKLKVKMVAKIKKKKKNMQ